MIPKMTTTDFKRTVLLSLFTVSLPYYIVVERFFYQSVEIEKPE